MLIPICIITSVFYKQHQVNTSIKLEFIGYDLGSRWNYRLHNLQPNMIIKHSSKQTAKTTKPILTLPTNENIRLTIERNSINNAWWKPSMNFNVSLPGKFHSMRLKINRPGIYHGPCGMLCGKKFATARITIRAKTPHRYAQWLLQQKHKTSFAKNNSKTHKQFLTTRKITLRTLRANRHT